MEWEEWVQGKKGTRRSKKEARSIYTELPETKRSMFNAQGRNDGSSPHVGDAMDDERLVKHGKAIDSGNDAGARQKVGAWNSMGLGKYMRFIGANRFTKSNILQSGDCLTSDVIIGCPSKPTHSVSYSFPSIVPRPLYWRRARYMRCALPSTLSLSSASLMPRIRSSRTSVSNLFQIL